MSNNFFDILQHLLMAMIAGGVIGLERSYNGHAAGFRTHALVCMASGLLMQVAIHQGQWFSEAVAETVKVDPTRMAQGIMTGIGFLGAGVIMKEGLSIRGLTTAASIWITAAIGILAGVGFYASVGMVTTLTLGTHTVFRWAESKIPALIYAHHSLCLSRETSLSERELRDLISGHGVKITKMSYFFSGKGDCIQYDMMIHTRNKDNIWRLSETLSKLDAVTEFRISLTGD